MSSLPAIEEITETFELLDDWEERYRYIIDLGRKLSGLEPEAKVEANRVQGCTSQVWLTCRVGPEKPARLHFEADSDAYIVRGLIGIVLALYSGKRLMRLLNWTPSPSSRRLVFGLT